MKQNSKNSLILFLTVFLDMMGFSIIFPIFPKTLKYFMANGNDPILVLFTNISLLVGKDPEMFLVIFGGIAAGIYSILQFIFAPIWGKLSDTYGRKPVLIFTSAGNLIGYITWLFSSNFTLFVISRIITGSMGGNLSVASAGMADVTSEKDRAKGMGMIGAGIGLGFLFGPTMGGIFSEFEITALIPSLPRESITIFSMAAVISIVIAFVNLILVTTVFKESHSKEHRTKRELHPMLSLNQVSSREILTLSLIYFLFMFSFAGFEFSLNFFLSEFLKFSPREIGYSFVYIGSIVILIQGGVIRRISGKVSEKKISLLGAGLIIIGYFTLSNSYNTYFTFIALTFLSAGSAFLNPGLSSLTSLFSSKMDQGKNIGLFRSFGALARALAPISYAVIYFSNGPNFTFTVSGIIGIIFISILFKL